MTTKPNTNRIALIAVLALVDVFAIANFLSTLSGVAS